MTYLAEQEIVGIPRWHEPMRLRQSKANAGVRCRDARWPAVAAILTDLRAAHRRSVRIVDADCGGGNLLLCAVHYARSLGFTAIEARGIDDAEAPVRRAQAAAANLHDPAISITFEATDLVPALDEEVDLPADIILWHGAAPHSDAETRAVACAGQTVISDPLPDAGAKA